MKWLIKVFGEGLVGLVVVVLIIFVFNFFFAPANQINNFLPDFLKFKGIEFLITLVLIFLLGLLISCLSNKIKHIPLVGHLLYSLKELSSAQSVLIPSLYGHGYMLGFLTPEKLNHPQTGEKLCAVFIPSTPNPTTGMIVWIKKSEIISISSIPRHEIIRIIVSGGFVQNHKKNRS